jgi:hypothetical protein
VGEVLALGLTHFPSLAKPDEAWGAVGRRMRADVGLPEAMRSPAGWPEGMRSELGEDDGRTAARMHRAAVEAEFAQVRTALEEFDPDYVLIWGDDQHENFQADLIPPFAILAYHDMVLRPWDKGPCAPAAPNVWNEGRDFEFPVRFHREGAKRLTSDLLTAGFDMAYAYEPNNKPLSHSFLNSVLYLDQDRSGFRWPLVPFHVNCYGDLVICQKGDAVGYSEVVAPEDLDPPAPAPWRCFDLGAACARAIRDSPYRVAIIASSGWSHAFLVRENYNLFPDLAADELMYKALLSGDYDRWRSRTLAEVVRSGQQEMLNWMCVAGAMQQLDLTIRHSAFIPTYIFNSPKVFLVAD